MAVFRNLGKKSSVLVIIALSLLSFIARALLDWRYVFPFFLELSPQDELISGLIYFLIILSVIAASLNISIPKKWPLFTLMAFHLIQFILLGMVSSLALCPSPCPTIWPIGEIIIWSSTVTGALGILSLYLYWHQKRILIG